MRIEGTLSKWIDDRGFGFITPSNGGPEIFVHISAFPRDGRRPMVGERLTFEIATSKEGRKRAIKLFCPDRQSVRTPQSVRTTRRPTYRHRTRTPGVRDILRRAASIFAVLALAAYGYNGLTRRDAAPLPFISTPQRAVEASPAFQCDGRRYCKQMTSCDEAKFFAQHCGAAHMDGDNDGIPCEREACSGHFR